MWRSAPVDSHNTYIIANCRRFSSARGFTPCRLRHSRPALISCMMASNVLFTRAASRSTGFDAQTASHAITETPPTVLKQLARFCVVTTPSPGGGRIDSLIVCCTSSPPGQARAPPDRHFFILSGELEHSSRSLHQDLMPISSPSRPADVKQHFYAGTRHSNMADSPLPALIAQRCLSPADADKSRFTIFLKLCHDKIYV